MGDRAGSDGRTSDHSDGLSLVPAIAARNFELDTLTLFKRPVAVGLNR
jgi:hypothetical protein